MSRTFFQKVFLEAMLLISLFIFYIMKYGWLRNSTPKAFQLYVSDRLQLCF